MVEFNYEVQNEGNDGGNMLYNYGLDHRELGEQFLVLTPTRVKIHHAINCVGTKTQETTCKEIMSKGFISRMIRTLMDIFKDKYNTPGLHQSMVE